MTTKPIKSFLCSNCICLPLCLNKDIVKLLSDCALLRQVLRDNSFRVNLHTCKYIKFLCLSETFFIEKSTHDTLFNGVRLNTYAIFVSVGIILHKNTMKRFLYNSFDPIPLHWVEKGRP